MSIGTAPVTLGFRAGRGGSVVAAIALEGRVPRLALSTYLATATEGDRLAREPYHMAAEVARDTNGDIAAEAAVIVSRGRKRQDELAAKGLDDILRQLQAANYAPIAGALLINRAGWITDLLQYSLGSPEHPAVAEGLAVRDAVRSACTRRGLDLAEFDEKSLPDIAPARLNLAPADIDVELKRLGAAAGRPWRQEQKLACLLAWIVASERASYGPSV